jgi:CubicO group peptidase (beta-lactamase class C family)
MDFSRATDFMNRLEGIGIPGADLAVYLKGNEAYRYQTGYANLSTRDPITPETLYAIWSMTKVITCVAALRLYEEGRFLLIDPLYEYIPEFKNLTLKQTKGNGELVEKPASKPIRIVDLFTMSSGYSYDVPGAFEKLKESNGNATLKELVLTLPDNPIAFEPGTRFSYGYSHDILGALIEVISGKTLGEYFSENIFMPLGMEDTGFKIPKEKHSRLATCYTYCEESKSHSVANLHIGYSNPNDPLYLSDDWKFEMAGGGLISSVDDYAKFANTLCRGGTSCDGYRLLGEPTIDLMTTNHLKKKSLHDYSGTWLHHSGYGYGLGVRTMIDRAGGGSNSCYGEFGWSGLPGTYVLIDPIMDLTIVYAQQLFPSKEEFIASRIRNIIYGCL